MRLVDSVQWLDKTIFYHLGPYILEEGNKETNIISYISDKKNRKMRIIKESVGAGYSVVRWAGAGGLASQKRLCEQPSPRNIWGKHLPKRINKHQEDGNEFDALEN